MIIIATEPFFAREPYRLNPLQKIEFMINNDDFEMFRDHCAYIRQCFNTYNYLFDKKNHELLEKISKAFFDEIHSILHQHWILQVCKLMDPETTRKCKNISIKLITNQVVSYLDKEKENIESLTKEIEKIKSLTKEIENFGADLAPARNKIIAHLDKKSIEDGKALGETTKEVDDFVKNIQEYCDLVGNITEVGPSDFSCSSTQGDVSSFLCFIGDVKEMVMTKDKKEQEVISASLERILTNPPRDGSLYLPEVAG